MTSDKAISTEASPNIPESETAGEQNQQSEFAQSAPENEESDEESAVQRGTPGRRPLFRN